MSNAKWEEEREELLKRLQKAERVVAESQAEAAVYRDMLEDCYRAADEALHNKDLDLLYKITGKLTFNWMPSVSEGKLWGKYFLDAYMRDAGWLEDTKKALEQIKAEAEKLLESDKINAELKEKIERIIAVADKGLVTHI
jgi:hypothetical protein